MPITSASWAPTNTKYSMGQICISTEAITWEDLTSPEPDADRR
jgi:hypothetical protein